MRPPRRKKRRKRKKPQKSSELIFGYVKGVGIIAERRKKAKIDEIMKHLFTVSKETLVTMLNSLFGVVYNPDEVEILQTNSEFDEFDFKIIRGDAFFRILRKFGQNPDAKPFHYHIEFQTLRDRLIGIRVFEYDFKKALENERLEGAGNDSGEIVLYMPKSMVIHVEANAKIPKEYKVKLVFTGENGEEQAVDYKIPVMRYWEYDEKRLVEEKLYPLLPLQLFLLRSELEKMARRKKPDGKRETIAKVKSIADQVVRTAHRLGDEDSLKDEDIEKITTAIGELFRHLNDKYKANTKLNAEVGGMIRTLYDERVFLRGKDEANKEMAIKLLKKGLSIEDIVDLTNLPIEEVEALRDGHVLDEE